MIFEGRKHGHIGVATTDVETDAQWYQDKLGYKVIGKFLGLSGNNVYFLQNGEIVYELFQPKVGVPEAVRGKIDHIAFASENIEDDYHYCVENGYTITTNGIEQIPVLWERGVRFFKVMSPTGEQIEFCQIL